MAIDDTAFDDTVAERLARRAHEHYLATQVRSGRSVDGSGAMRSWDDLPEDMKLANRAQVQDIVGKLDLIGCRIEPGDVTTRAFSLLDQEVELLAQCEHERWCSERTSRGWRVGPVRDDANRIHPALLPWRSLPEPERDKDRAAVRGIPELLAAEGYDIRRT